MRLDARSSSHAIVQPVATVAQAEQAFDAITYKKGEAVIRMLETYAGSDAWREGVRAYIAEHAYGVATNDDLWRAVDKLPASPSRRSRGTSSTSPACRYFGEFPTFRREADAGPFQHRGGLQRGADLAHAGAAAQRGRRPGHGEAGGARPAARPSGRRRRERRPGRLLPGRL
jgi:hypothetical protein